MSGLCQHCKRESTTHCHECQAHVCSSRRCRQTHDQECVSDINMENTNNENVNNSNQNKSNRIRRLADSQENRKKSKKSTNTRKQALEQKRKLDKVLQELLEQEKEDEKQKDIELVTQKMNDFKVENEEDIISFITQGLDLAVQLVQYSGNTKMVLSNVCLKTCWQIMQNILTSGEIRGIMESIVFKEQLFNKTNNKKPTETSQVLEYMYTLISPHCFRYRIAKDADNQKEDKIELFGTPMDKLHFIQTELNNTTKSKHVQTFAHLMAGNKISIVGREKIQAIIGDKLRAIRNKLRSPLVKLYPTLETPQRTDNQTPLQFIQTAQQNLLNVMDKNLILGKEATQYDMILLERKQRRFITTTFLQLDNLL